MRVVPLRPGGFGVFILARTWQCQYILCNCPPLFFSVFFWHCFGIALANLSFFFSPRHCHDNATAKPWPTPRAKTFLLAEGVRQDNATAMPWQCHGILIFQYIYILVFIYNLYVNNNYYDLEELNTKNQELSTGDLYSESNQDTE